MTGRWQARAACRSQPTERFYPEGHRDSRPYLDALELALAFCEQCPVRVQCADQAARDQERHGVWGGLDLTTDWRRDGRRRAS